MDKLIEVLKYALSLALAGLLLYLAFRNIDFREFVSKSKEADYTWVAMSIALSVAAYYARAYRWNILLGSLGHKGLSVHRTNLAVLVGYLSNLAFPRLGEVTRCGMMKRTDNVGISEGLGTVVVDRISDLAALLLLSVVALFMEYGRLMAFLEGLGVVWRGLPFIGLSGAASLFALYLLYRKSPRARGFINRLLRGLSSLRKIKNVPGFILSTLVLWAAYYFMSYLIVFSVPETAGLPWEVGIMLLVTGGIALAIPVQGGIGTYHAMVSAMLALYQVESTTGVFLATLLHTSQVMAILVFGSVALAISFFVQKSNGSAYVQNP